MVKAVVGDETQLNLAEDRLSQSGLTSQVGLVIGKLSSSLDRGFVYDLVPTPPNDAGEPACSLIETTTAATFKDDKKKGSKSKSQPADSSTLAIDRDWVAEHARQVSRMLVGGMNVVGIYVWISDSSFKNSTITLCQTVKGVAEAAPIQETDYDKRLLIHISYSPRRWTCRNCILSSNITSSSIRPCDFKMGRVLSLLQTFKCTYNFKLRCFKYFEAEKMIYNMTDEHLISEVELQFLCCKNHLPICQENTSKSSTLSAILRHGISVHAKELRNAIALIDGNLVVNEEPCSNEGLHEVELLLPFMKNTQAEACSQKDAIGVLIFSGSVCSFAYLNPKEPVSQAIADIKDDIIRSLQSRLDIICDEADEDPGPIGEDDIEAIQPSEKPVSRLILCLLRKTCSLAFPRRLFIPWLAGTFICDYLQPSETLEVLKDHCVELMSMEAPADASTILQPEVEAPPMVAKSFWDVGVPGHSASSFSVEKSRRIDTSDALSSTGNIKSINFKMLGAFFFLILSIFVGFLLLKRS